MERKLQISELSIGDWVMVKGEPRWVTGLNLSGPDEHDTHISVCGLPSLFYEDEITSIPLTPDILEKNGFERSKEYSGNNRTPYIFRRGKRKGPFDKVTVNLFHPTDKRLFRRGVYHELVYESPMFAGHWNFAYVKYVHELQHALRLAGIDKEIEL